MPAEVETMFSGNRVVPWHRLGNVVEGQLNAAEALIESGLDWEVEKRPLYVSTSDTDESSFVKVPRKFANVRSSDDKVLGVVGSKYEVLQNKAAFDFMDALVDDGSAKYETAGSLRGGSVVWMSMTLPEGVTIAGDAIDIYILLRNSHDGTSQGTGAVTPVRTVCRNTMNLALAAATRMWSFRHIGDIASKMLEARRALDITFEYTAELERVGNGLATESLTDNAFKAIVEELTDVEKHAEGMMAAFTASDNLENVRNTKWAAVNAVGEYWEHLRDQRSPEAQMRSTINGKARSMRDRTLELVSS